MPTLCRAYTTDDEAKAAVNRLFATGIAGAEIRVLMGEATHDGRDEPDGRFGGGAEAVARSVGSFGNTPGSSRDAMGEFAGPTEDQRRGGFGDLDRDTITTYPTRASASPRTGT
jgi:hypothetical protein